MIRDLYAFAHQESKMTTNNSGKLNMGGVAAIKEITAIPAADWTEHQRYRLNACLAALAHQPTRWYGYQDWGAGGPVRFWQTEGSSSSLVQTEPLMDRATTMDAGVVRSTGV